MTRLLIVLGVAVLVLWLMAGCSTLNKYGIGGPPEIVCRNGLAFIDDRIAGSDNVRLSALRRLPDGDGKCKPAPKAGT